MNKRQLLLSMAALLLSVNLLAQPGDGGGPGGGSDSGGASTTYAYGTEINLALALQAHSSVKSVDFETIWGQGHTEAEDSGSASSNFISWVKECSTSSSSGIETVDSQPAQDETIYDLLGRKVTKMHKGVYIQGGKKYIK